MTSKTEAELPSVIAYNCSAAYFYQGLSSRYLSPLIGNLFRDWRQFLRFAGDLRGYLAERPRFGDPLLPRFHPDRNYPVMFLRDAEIHWIHTATDDQALHRFNAGLARLDMDNIAVVFCEANLGVATLGEADVQEFRTLWDSIPYRKVFFSSGRYGRFSGETIVPRWRGERHEDVCGEDGILCKPDCFGCKRPLWGRFVQEGTMLARALGFGDRFVRVPPKMPTARELAIESAHGREQAPAAHP